MCGVGWGGKVGRRLGQKQKTGENRMSNKTRQNNKRADRKMESNDSPHIPDREETSEELSLPSGPKERKSLREDFEIIKYRCTHQKARNKTKEQK